ncbi:MAG TPA: metallophosphoesterase [Acidimicrobiia bacterium]|nr:metallophosphoesterase [Acidimicrobiia bacterium]
MGDWGSGTAPQGAVAGAMQRHAEQNDASVILTTGDNFYSDDAEFLMAPYVWVEDAGMQWWIAWGNHDVETPTRIEAVNETFDDPPRWGVFQWDDFDVVILDSNQITSATQAAFFLDAMAASERPTIVVMHHPPYSCSHEAETVELVNRVVEVMDDDVVLVLSGHDHTFQRFESEGVSYVVTGGGGSQLYPIQDCPPSHPELIAGEELHHFLALSAEDGDLVVEAIDVNGEVFHEFVLELG